MAHASQAPDAESMKYPIPQFSVGTFVGRSVGAVGSEVGAGEGRMLGNGWGTGVGSAIGSADGTGDGAGTGAGEGAGTGATVGRGVGSGTPAQVHMLACTPDGEEHADAEHEVLPQHAYWPDGHEVQVPAMLRMYETLVETLVADPDPA